MVDKTLPPQQTTESTPWPHFPFPIAVTPEQAFRAAVSNPSVPKIYGNTFTNVIGASDITLMFGIHGTASAVVSLAYPAAKALAAGLTAAVLEYETKTNSKVLDAASVEKMIQAKP